MCLNALAEARDAEASRAGFTARCKPSALGAENQTRMLHPQTVCALTLESLPAPLPK